MQAGYDYNAGSNEYWSKQSKRWLSGGHALMEFYGQHFPGEKAKVISKGRVWDDPFATVQIKDQGDKLELERIPVKSDLFDS